MCLFCSEKPDTDNLNMLSEDNIQKRHITENSSTAFPVLHKYNNYCPENRQTVLFSIQTSNQNKQ